MSDLFGTAPTSSPASNPDDTTSASSSLPPMFSGPSQGSGFGGSGPGPSVYYYVLLGVLVTLIVLAGSLTYRTYRLRRRYRTATQLAIARGDPVPPGEWWGRDRVNDPWGLALRRTTRPKRWVRVPKLWDATAGDEKEAEIESEEEDGWIGQPLTVTSRLPAVEQQQQPQPQIQMFPSGTARGRLTAGGFRRYWTPEEQRAREMQGERDRPPTPPNPLEQEVVPGEEVRVAFVVQMPVMPAERASMRTGLSEEEEVGWLPGMEIGVWEGIVEPEEEQMGESSGDGPTGGHENPFESYRQSGQWDDWGRSER